MSEQKQRLTFISYSRADSEFALELAKELRSSGFYIWLDQLDIPTGARWDDEVEKALLECEIFMVILTPDSIASNNVKDEIGYAIDSNKRILPVLLENAVLPFRLRRFQYVDFTKKSYDDGIEAAKQLLRKLLSESPASISLTPADTEEQKARSLPADSEVKPPAHDSIERQAHAASQMPAVPSKIPEKKIQIKAFGKNYPIAAGVGLFSIVCLVAGWVIARSLFGPTATPSPDITITRATAASTSTPTHTATAPATSTPTPTATVTVTPLPKEVAVNIVTSYFNTLINKKNYDLAWSMLTDDFKKNNNPGTDGKDNWIALWKTVDRWEGKDFKVTYFNDNTQALVSGTYVFGRGKPSSINYCLVWNQSQNTWMIDYRKNCPQ